MFAHNTLIYHFVRRDIAQRYKGSFLGIAWSFFLPLATLAMYTVVFGMILKPRWEQAGSPLDFSLILFSGLLLFQLLSECIHRAVSIIPSHTSYVKKVVFPLEILVWMPIGSALYHLCFGLLAWFLLAFILGSLPGIQMIVLPLILVPLVLMTAGICWVAAAIGVYIRDLAQVVGLGTQLLFYLSPLLYPRSIVPAPLNRLMLLNPLTIPIEQVRRVLHEGLWPEWEVLGVYTLVAMIVAFLGRRCFHALRAGFADVL